MSLCFNPSPLYPSVYIGGRRSTRESRQYTALSASPDSSPYIHPPPRHQPRPKETPTSMDSERRIAEAKRTVSTLVPRYVPPASISPKSAASPASVSLSYHGKTLESATDWADAVRTALAKDSKGYPDRLSGYLTSTRAIAELSSTYSLRLASFFYQELVHTAATLRRKNAEYEQQLMALSEQQR